MAETKTKVATRPPLTLRQQVEAARAQIATVLPKHMDVDQVLVAVRLAIAQNPTLNACTPTSVLFSVLAACRLGLEINSPLQHCWLIPYKDQCTLQVGYRGYQELARRGGEIRNVEARAVYQGDDFEYELGSKPFVKHKPGGSSDAKNLTHAYAIAFPKDGGTPIVEVMLRSEIEAARKVSRFADRPDSPWTLWFAEMARKTAVRRLSKYLPLSPEMAAAIELDIRGDTGKVTSTSTLIDSDASLAAGMQERTEAQLQDLKGKLGGQPPKVDADGVVSAPTATGAPEAPPPPADGQPW